MGKVSKNLLKVIDKKDVVSFDIFDTLIKRNCNNPKDVFRIVEKKYNNHSDEKINDFYSMRIEAEAKAREVNSAYEDITFEQIYEHLPYEKKIRNFLMELEIETELEFCQKNINMYPIYQECLKKKKKIICITDMYLPKNVIAKILDKCGYDIEDVFVSSEYRQTKLSGNLFKTVMKKLNINKSKILHIGDSWKADFIGALKCGILPHHIQKNISNSLFSNDENIEDLSINIMTSYIKNNVSSSMNYYEKLGYEIVGPMCYLMCMWFYHTSKENGIDNLLFCARDMKLIQEIFNLIYNNEIKNNYFYVSRKSTYLPFLYINNNFESFEKLIPSGGRRKITIVELLGMYNIVISDLNKVLKDYNLDYDTKYELEQIKKNSDFRKFYEKIVVKFVNSEGKIQYNNFLSYLDSLSFTNKSAIVDLGWRGTTQNIMIDILGHNVKGLYLGLHTLNGKNLKNNYFTYLFSGKEELYSKKVYACMSLCELVLSALHGSVVSYTDSKEKPYVLNTSANSNNAFIEQIQKGALDFCKGVVKYKSIIENNGSKKFIDLFIKIGIDPTYKQAKNLGEIYTENIKIRKLAKPDRIIKYILKPNRLKDDLIDSEWKTGFMKRLFVVNLPYYKIYNFLRKNKEEV